MAKKRLPEWVKRTRREIRGDTRQHLVKSIREFNKSRLGIAWGFSPKFLKQFSKAHNELMRLLDTGRKEWR